MIPLFFGALFARSGAFLPDADHACKFADSHQPLLLCRSIGFVQPVRDNQLHVCCLHLCGLLFTDARLDGQQMFVPDSFCFVENLTAIMVGFPYFFVHDKNLPLNKAAYVNDSSSGVVIGFCRFADFS